MELPLSHRENKRLIILLGFALAVRVTLVFTHGDSNLANEWDPLVKNLLSGRGYAYYSVSPFGEITAQYLAEPAALIPSAYMPPLYAGYLAAIAYFTGLDYWGIKLTEMIQAGIGVLTLLFVFKTAKLKFDTETAWIALLALTIYPVLAYMPGQISAVNAYVFLNCSLIYLLVRWESTGNGFRWMAMGGVISGLLMLSRPDFIIYFLFICIWIRQKRSRAVKSLAIYLSMAAMCLIPWVTRNYIIFHRFIPLTTSGGINLWEGQNQNASGTRSNYVVPNIEISPAMSKAINSLRPTQDYEIKRDRIYREYALADLKAEPWRAAKLAWIKFTFLWGHYWGIHFSYPGAESFAYWFPWFFQLPFFVYGLYTAVRKRRGLSLFYAYLIISTSVAMVFFVIPRYRIFILPVVLLFAAYGLKEIFGPILLRWVAANARENR